MNPISEKNVIVSAALAALKRRFRNRFTSSIGTRTRRSCAMNSAKRTAVTTNPPIVSVAPHPRLGASMIV